MRAAYAVAGVALAVTGCEKAQADRVEKSVTTIEDRGARPQYMLRYDIPAGFSQDLDEVIDVDMHISGAQTQDLVMPRMIVNQTISIDKVDARGGMHLSSETGEIRMLDDAASSLPPGAATAMKAIEGMRMTATVSPNGATHGMKIDMASIPATGREMAQQVEQAMDSFVAKFPDVSVGEGARWTVAQTLRLSNMKVFYTFHYEVLEVTETTVSLHADLEISAPPQPIITAQGTAHLDAMVGEGTVDMELDLHRLVEQVTSDTSVTMTMVAGGQAFQLDLGTHLQVLPNGAEPAPRATPSASY